VVGEELVGQSKRRGKEADGIGRKVTLRDRRGGRQRLIRWKGKSHTLPATRRGWGWRKRGCSGRGGKDGPRGFKTSIRIHLIT